MANYTYKEIINTLTACGFQEVQNNNGSHQMYVHAVTGFAQPVPKHSNGIVSNGTAESILNYAVMQAVISRINIANNKFGLGKNVIEYIKKQHKKIKENYINIVPEKVRTQCGIKTPEDAKKFIKLKVERMQAYNRTHKLLPVQNNDQRTFNS